MLPEIKTILYATDLEEKGSKNAFRMAVSLASCHQAQLVFLHAIEPISSSAEAMIRNTFSDQEYDELKEKGMDTLREQMKAKIDEFCREECSGTDMKYPGGDPVIVVEVGDSDQVILHNIEQHDADMVVMGTRTHSNIGQIVLGSTANKVIHHSQVPVLVYPL